VSLKKYIAMQKCENDMEKSKSVKIKSEALTTNTLDQYVMKANILTNMNHAN
jgi:hypothetical protein